MGMPILATLLLVAVVALRLGNTVAVNVVLEAVNVGFRSQWGANDVLLTCSSDGLMGPINHANFTRNQLPVTISDDIGCNPSGDQYCYGLNGERLSFIANNATEGKYACHYQGQTSNKLAIVGKCVLYNYVTYVSYA